MFADDICQASVAPEDAKAMNEFSVLAWIVIHEANRSITQLAIVEQLAQQQFAGVAGAIDKDAAAIGGGPVRQHLAEKAEGDSATGQQQEHHDRVDRKY